MYEFNEIEASLKDQKMKNSISFHTTKSHLALPKAQGDKRFKLKKVQEHAEFTSF